MREDLKGILKGMGDKANQVRDRLGGNAAFLKRLNLSGKNAVVKPGGSVIIRVLPRWNYKDKYIMKGGKWVANPNYEDGFRHFEAFEHWWDGEQGQRNRVWCPRTFNLEEDCPICGISEKLQQSPDQNDKKFGKDISRSEVFLFNVIMRDSKTKLRAVNEKGEPDIKILVAPNTIFLGISDIMSGGGDSDYSFGDIMDPKEGHDIKLTRPATGGAERWRVDVNPKSTPLYAPEQAEACKGWQERMHDLPEWVKEELVDPAELAKKFGVDADKPALPGGRPAVTGGSESPTGFEGGTDGEPTGATPAWGLGGEEEPPF